MPNSSPMIVLVTFCTSCIGLDLDPLCSQPVLGHNSTKDQKYSVVLKPKDRFNNENK